MFASFVHLLEFFMACCVAVFLIACVALSLPQNNEVRQFLMRGVRFAAILLSGAYVVSPVDLVPEAAFGPVGLIDDALVAVFGSTQYRALRKPATPR